MSSFFEKYDQMNREAREATAKATKDSESLPKGTYSGKIKTLDLDWCQDDEGNDHPLVIVGFEIVTSAENPRLCGRILKEWLRWSPSFDDGSSQGEQATRKIYKKAFNKEFPVGDPDAEKAAFEELTTLAGTDTEWKLTRKESKSGYINTTIGGIVSQAA